MREPLTLAVAQPLLRSHDVAANALAHAEAVHAADARVVVFPELSLTGYELEAAALRPNDPRLAPLVSACAERGALALAGAPVPGEGEQMHIAMLAVDGSGARVAYRKNYLGGDETKRFTPGPEPVVLHVDGWRLGLAICKDTGIHQHSADTAALGLDVYVAGVLEAEEDAHIQEERARRISREHGVWVAVASFAGSTGGGYSRAAGRSAIWKPGGERLSQAGPEVGAIVRATLTDPA